MVFVVLFQQVCIDELHIAEHFFLTSLPRTFSEATIIDKHHIIVVPVKITGVLCPALYAPRIAMKVKNKTKWLLTVKMQTVDPDTGLYIKK